jgi:hypothetical protein
MDVMEVSKRKKVLENQLLACVEEFERDTGAIVTELRIERYESMGGDDHIVIGTRVEVE